MNYPKDLSIYLGHITEKQCPDCGEPVIKDATNTEWCSGEDCCWSNDQDLQEFIQTITGTDENH